MAKLVGSGRVRDQSYLKSRVKRLLVGIDKRIEFLKAQLAELEATKKQLSGS